MVFVYVLLRVGWWGGGVCKRSLSSTCSASKSGEYPEILPKCIRTAPLDVSPRHVVVTVILYAHIASLDEQKWWTQPVHFCHVQFHAASSMLSIHLFLILIFWYWQ